MHPVQHLPLPPRLPPQLLLPQTSVLPQLQLELRRYLPPLDQLITKPSRVLEVPLPLPQLRSTLLLPLHLELPRA
jgi:hypothetical protein